MTEGERESATVRTSSRPADSSVAPRPPRGGGRGRGRGRGRRGGRGRGGRGRGRNNNGRNNVVSERTDTKSTTGSCTTDGEESRDGEEEKPPLNSNNNGGRGRHGRGGGRGRRGRSSSGRGRKGNGGGGRLPKSPRVIPPPSDDDDNDNTTSPAMAAEEETATCNDEVVRAPERNAKNTDAGNKTGNKTAKRPHKKSTPGILSLPAPPQVDGRVPMMILSRQSHPPALVDYDTAAQQLSERLAAEALEDENEEEKKDVALDEKPKPTKQRRSAPKSPPPVVVAEEDPPQLELSATEALRALPAQEVSITEDTQVQIRLNDASASLLVRPDSCTPKTKAKTTKSKSKKKKGLSNDDAANLKAARNFNKAVRACVERSDPDAMREILHDKRNHNFALDENVLETVMKAYVMAAMFEDALYCLRNCAMPGTLSTMQTERILSCLPQNLRNSSAYTAADMINALCIATEFDKPTSRTYFLRIVRGISLEFLEEATSARDRICSAPCERLVRAALCVVDACLKRGKKPTDVLVVPGNQLGVFVPDTENRGIQPGDAVSILPYAGPYPMSAESLDRNMIEATVINTNPMVLRLQDKTNANLHAMLTEAVEGNIYRIDKLANRMGFNRQLAAAVSIASPLEDPKSRDARRPSSELIKSITAMDENIDRVMKQSGALPKGELTSTAALCAQAVPWCFDDEKEEMDEDAIRAASTLALEKYGALEGLNASQRLAVEGATTNRLTLVQGPPGTGKTAVAIRILQHWARLAENEKDSSPTLATSDSNIAVDNLVEGCANAGLRVVRLGRPEAVRPELLRYCIDRPPSSYSNNNSYGLGSQSYGTRAYKERLKSLKNAQVICCTCIGSGGDILDAMSFHRVLVDEATQATEPAVLVPLMRGCQQLVLVGDHCQLPPTVLSTRAEEEGHGVPLFSRMVACGVPPFMLDTQYRMHPCIAMFPSDLFYGGKLRNGVSAPERRPLAGFPWPREEFPVAFVPVKGVEVDDGVSKLNEDEASAACHAVADLLSGGQCNVSDIAVVTPYAAQARLIRRMTRQLTQNNGPPFIEVSSVDGFQGREKEAVVFSAVRSNDHGAIGFASDWRRVNVSFTRARRALIVIGNDVTLRRGDPDTWMPWLAWVDAHGLNMDKPGIPRGRYDPEQLRRVRGGTTAAEMLKDVLERQKAQLKTAEKQLEKAEKNAAGHIIGNADDEEGNGQKQKDMDKHLTLEEDLARLANIDGNWDDSDDEDKLEMHRSTSQPTLSSASSSSNDLRVGGCYDEDNSPDKTDVWDL